MHELATFSVVTFSAIFFVIDPLGLVPIFIALTSGDSPEKRRKTAARACLIAFAILTAFTLFGTLIFKAFGITLSAFRIAGGILFFITSLDMLRGQPSRTRSSPEEEEEGHHKEDVAIVPLAIPLLAGPGAIALAMVSVSNGDGWWATPVVIGSIALTLVVAYVLMRAAERFLRYLGRSGIAMLERVMGLLLAAIAVQFVVDGVREIIRSRGAPLP